jgi:hypothetical protein
MTSASTGHSDRTARILDIVAVFMLSITAVVTAWCGFQSSKWGGEMSIAFSQASSARVQATAAEGEARDFQQYDLTIWSQWVLAQQAGDDELREYIEARFTPEFAVAFEAWDEQGRTARGPFAVPEYVPPGTEEAAEFSARADAKFDEALANNQRGDNYTILTVLFALVLFFTAMSQRDIVRWARTAMLTIAAVIAMVGAVVLLTYPVRI